VLVVSDHGAKRMDGGICINEWLIRNGYLRLHSTPAEPKRLDQVDVDWDRTIAWGEGGYHGRIYLNVKGREPRGVIVPSDYEKVRQELIAAIEAIEDPDGRVIGSRAYRPEDMYPHGARGIAPDLTVYFGDLSWRSVGSVGLGAVHTFENDTGPDEANHDWKAIFLANRAATSALDGALADDACLSLPDVAGMALRIAAAD
ncbi:MAG: alkaline phosphatase family protein, partial [Candidatus Binatia bacterium]